MTIATAKPSGLFITSLISPHPTLTAIAFQYLIIMIGHPQYSHYDTALMLLHVIKSIWSHQSVPMIGSSLVLSLVLNTFLLSLEPHYIHDKTSDASTEMMDMAVDSKITIFSPSKKPYKLGDTLALTQAMTWSQSVLNQLWT
jgi:hypothetical protein